jgi:hypothetical protein
LVAQYALEVEMGKRITVDRETTVREEPEINGLAAIATVIFWLTVIGTIIKGCGG